MKRVGIIILAAGGAKRFGTAKLLLRIEPEKTLIRHIAEVATSSGLSPLFCVTGKHNESIVKEIHDLPITCIPNVRWESGISSSVQVGINALGDDIDACLVLLGDQPFISRELLHYIADEYQRSKADVIIPTVNGERANPVLLDRVVFASIRTLTGDVGAKSLFSEFDVKEIPWEDERLPLDIDTLSDFTKFQSLICRSS